MHETRAINHPIDDLPSDIPRILSFILSQRQNNWGALILQEILFYFCRIILRKIECDNNDLQNYTILLVYDEYL